MRSDPAAGLAPWGFVAGAQVVLALIAGAFAAWRRHRQRAGIEALERQARELATIGLEQRAEPRPSAPPPLGPELERLGNALNDLGRRLEGQVKEVARTTRNLEALIAAMDEALLATDNQDRILLCNRAAESVLGAGPGELAGRRVDEVFTHAELIGMHRAARAGGVHRARVRLVTTLGARVFQVSASPVPPAPASWGEGVFGAVMILRDVTELDHAAQLKTDFVANASHELRTPVAAIRGAAETLRTALTDDPAMAARVSDMIVTHSARLEELLRDLLDLSRLESPDQRAVVGPVDLAGVRRELEALFEPACRARGLRLVFDLDDDLLHIRTDRKLLLLILRNLVENAVKFAFDRTEVRITGEIVEQHMEGGTGTPPGARPEGAARALARFEVSDQGIGIPIAQQDRVFERFYQVEPARASPPHSSGDAFPIPPTPPIPPLPRGTGLGLAIVKHIANRHRGGLVVESGVGQGASFVAYLPLASAAVRAEPAAVAKAS
jgi:two-component system phosphate regulon sensor histidine kinase PhoR